MLSVSLTLKVSLRQNQQDYVASWANTVVVSKDGPRAYQFWNLNMSYESKLTGKLVPHGEFVVRRPAVFAKEPKTPAAAEYLGQASELRRCVLRALGLVEGGPLFGVGIARFPTALHRCAPLTLKKIADFLV